MFLSLFLSVAIASTLFAGILQGADAIGARSLDQVFDSAPYDVITTAPDKNITKTRITDVEELFGHIDGVERLDYFVWSPIRLYEPETVNTTIDGVYLVAIPDESIFYEGIVGVDKFERGKIYFDGSSSDVDPFLSNGSAVIEMETYLWQSPPGFENRRFTRVIEDSVGVNDETWTLFVNRYDAYLRNLFSKNDPNQRRPAYNLILMSMDTYMDIQEEIFAEDRRPTNDQNGVALIDLDRNDLVNPWDVDGSIGELDVIYEQINSEGAEFYFVPRNFLGEILNAVKSNSNQMKTSTIMVSLPVFFTAWYLSVTISEVVFGLRRKEIGLFLTRGLTSKQVFSMLIFEGLLVAVLAGIVGVAGSCIVIPFVIQGVSPVDILLSTSPITFVSVFMFSLILALVSLYGPARKAVQINVVDALRDYSGDDEEKFSYLEPTIAAVLGVYRMAMIYFSISVDMFRPSSSNLIINLLYTTWWGSDYLLSFIAPILLFWGITKLFIQYAPWYQTLLTRVAGYFVGEVANFSALSSRRNLRRTAASTFMIALIVGYSVTVIGNVASSQDFMVSAVKTSVGAEAAVWLFEGQESEEVLENVLTVPEVESATIEVLFNPDTSLMTGMPVKGIDPVNWSEIVYLPSDFVQDSDMFKAMEETENGAIIEYGAGQLLGLRINNTMLIQTAARTYQVRIVGFFGTVEGDSYVPSNTMMYVSHTFMKGIKERYISKRRVVANLDEDVNAEAIKTALENVHEDIQRVDIAAINLEHAVNNIILAGPKQIQILGTFFAGLVASVGVVLIISTMIRSRIKELTIMTIRGYSPRQLSITLLTEHLGMDIFAILLGGGIGLITLYGVINLLNSSLGFIFAYRVVYPTRLFIQMGSIIALIIASTIIPIVVSVNRIAAEPNLKLEE